MLDLSGVAVLVTRPDQQATPLCNLLEARGAVALRLAAIHIEAVPNVLDLKLGLGPIDAFDLIIFTSANAVKFGTALLGEREQREPKLAAIGPATARALEQAGFRTLVPRDGFDSETLLRHSVLDAATAQRILIVKGIGGRDEIQRELERRGAHVTVAEVYRRTRMQPSAETLAALEARFVVGEVHVITATSAEIAESLLQAATPLLRREFERVQWLVPSARVAAALRSSGLAAPVILADSAEDHDLVAAIARWRASVSGA
jgi:uroporphyrinogen-III synthase